MKTLQHKFVEYIPDILEEGIIYITIEYRTAVHKCICGCGNKVVTPITPKDWKLIFDGKSISLYPSIGNWDFKCKSHYYITNNKIVVVRERDDSEHREKRKSNRGKYKRNRFLHFPLFGLVFRLCRCVYKSPDFLLHHS
ncbi:DUF6527 family protein [Parasediminibacterium sp. JCM 36343]|uniref:DUF6527 family protein n=1 Tax=Parasediminibacterium sp. JCM 36343 TaxID=3374279 RepID=UPI00397D7D8F